MALEPGFISSGTAVIDDGHADEKERERVREGGVGGNCGRGGRLFAHHSKESAAHRDLSLCSLVRGLTP